jgi:hypothetical protein
MKRKTESDFCSPPPIRLVLTLDQQKAIRESMPIGAKNGFVIGFCQRIFASPDHGVVLWFCSYDSTVKALEASGIMKPERKPAKSPRSKQSTPAMQDKRD